MRDTATLPLLFLTYTHARTHAHTHTHTRIHTHTQTHTHAHAHAHAHAHTCTYNRRSWTGSLALTFSSEKKNFFLRVNTTVSSSRPCSLRVFLGSNQLTGRERGRREEGGGREREGGEREGRLIQLVQCICLPRTARILLTKHFGECIYVEGERL